MNRPKVICYMADQETGQVADEVTGEVAGEEAEGNPRMIPRKLPRKLLQFSKPARGPRAARKSRTHSVWRTGNISESVTYCLPLMRGSSNERYRKNQKAKIKSTS